MDGYKRGGYHPVQKGEIYNGRYVVREKLGWGHFSTVWLALDQKTNQFVALKVQKSAKEYTEAALDEIEILTTIKKNSTNADWLQSANEYGYRPHNDSSSIFTGVVDFIDFFEHHGPNGKHVCMVFEMMGVNLLAIIKRYDYKGIPFPVVRQIAKQVLIGLDYLHRICHIIHTDLKPENVLVCLTAAEKSRLDMHLAVQNAQESHSSHHHHHGGHKHQHSTPKAAPQPPTTETGAQSGTHEQPEISRKKRRAMKKKQKRKEKRIAKMAGGGADKEPQDNVEDEEDDEEDAEQAGEGPVPTDKEASSTNNNNNNAATPAPPGANPTGPIFSKSSRRRASALDESVQVKVVDLGNACWTDLHFSADIQTRQYRSPEVILGINYNTSADMWSMACMLFELVTGDFLFEPKSGEQYSRDEDHIAQFVELLGPLPKRLALSGKYSKTFYNRHGDLKHIKKLKFWALEDVLMEKYNIPAREAISFASFLKMMLVFDPQKRATAQECLQHPWLAGDLNVDISDPLFGRFSSLTTATEEENENETEENAFEQEEDEGVLVDDDGNILGSGESDDESGPFRSASSSPDPGGRASGDSVGEEDEEEGELIEQASSDGDHP
eukprot:GILJ01004472.1.p1 GENE.GILJ01004472.1~~GILJ01004472.1.p1  ORF type:complete len:610 (-),score=112.30 GILJ01004472.1:93-1922(-)